jgi:hypothetical protein
MAATATNPINSYELTVETKINIDELIAILNPEDLPMLGGVNSDGFPTIPKMPVDNTVFYWLEEDMPTPRTVVGTALATTVTTLVVASGETVKFSAGDLIRINSEVLQIVSIDSATNMTVARAQLGTSDPGSNHAVGAEVIGLGTYLDEGDVGDQQFRGRDRYSNYTQIWTSKISMTRTEQVIPKYGIPSELARQVRSIMLSEGVNMEQTLLYGVKHETAPRRATGGLSFFITTNAIANGASGNWLTVNEVEKRQQVAYDAGGMFGAIVARPINFRALTNTAGAERIQTVTVDDPRRGRRRATSVITEFGEVELVRNRYARLSDAFGINRENVIHRVLQPMVMQPLAKTDDKDNYMFVAEGGFEVKAERHMVKWTGLDPTQSLPTNLV